MIGSFRTQGCEQLYGPRWPSRRRGDGFLYHPSYFCLNLPVSFFLLLSRTDSLHWDEASMLYVIGLGLADERDVSAKGLEIIRRAERVYLESYTAVLLVNQEQLV